MDKKKTSPSTTEMIGIGVGKPQYIPKQVHRAIVEEFFRNSTATVVAHIRLVDADGKPIAYGDRAVIETSEERKD